MNYCSVSDLARTIQTGLHIIPADIDLIVGIPRSGLLAGSLLALHLNLKCTGLDAFINNTPLLTGTRRPRYLNIEKPHNAMHILLVDDSAASGTSMQNALQAVRMCGYSGKITTCAIFKAPDCQRIDIHLKNIPLPRIFEWNLMHRDYLSSCCVDMDGVLCADPTPEQNDDGPNYQKFLDTATPLLIPTYKIGKIVTSRLEKYRSQTVRWLMQHNIEYGSLEMLDMPTAQLRRETSAHAPFKAGVYSQNNHMTLFIESERAQAMEIARLSGKFVLCISTQELFSPSLTFPYVKQASKRWIRKGVRFLRQISARN